jgi:tetratricopeptide (TPR) repeat protein
LATIDKHYQILTKKYGYEIPTPEYTVNALGYSYLGEKKFDEAIKVFKENVKRYPKSANVYDSLGEAYENNDQLAEAEKNYTIAVKIAEKEDHAYLKTYEDNLKRVQTTLAEK